MNTRIAAIFIFAAGAFAAPSYAAGKSAAELEKEKAMANPYPNDLGPDNIDSVVEGYKKDAEFTKKRPFSPKDPSKTFSYADGYANLKARCAQCHPASRPLNSRFVEPEGGAAGAAKAKKEVDAAANPFVWQIEEKVWNRYVKRMMAKPGCKISNEEGRTIFEFLVYDSSKRKLGANAAAWKAHRQKLLDEFKAKHPARYKELLEHKDL